MSGAAWFAVVPDAEAGAAAARALTPRAAEVTPHHSGRPWLLGSWPTDRMHLAEAGDARLAVIGRCPVTADALAGRLRAMRDVTGMDQALVGLAGSFYAVASLGGRVRVRGTASAVRRVFHTELGGVTVAASRADVLAQAANAEVDEGQLVLHLLSSPLPYPLGEGRTLWRGVRSVRAGHCLLLEPDGRGRAQRWWNPPEPHLPCEQGAIAVRQGLVAAVDSCTATRPDGHREGARQVVSADLSGGLDSTTLCFLAAPAPAHLVTFRWESVDPGNDDAAWARRAAAALPGAEHVLPEPTDAALWFSGLTEARATTDEPGTWARDSARLGTLARLMTARGSRLHLTGGGGDELFGALPPYLYDAVRSHPVSGLRHANRQRVMQRRPLWPMLRGLADRSTFRQWLASWADGLTASLAAVDRAPGTAWGTELRMPVWATSGAVEQARDLLHAAAAAAPEPLAAQRGQHAALSSVQSCGRAFRQTDQVADGLGLPLAAPYLDDGVIEAALSVRTTERGAPDRYKPVLTTAMRGLVPDALLARSTKGEYTADFHHALRHNKAALLDLFDGSRLAEAGLVDEGCLRANLRRPGLPSEVMRALDTTLACEMWLRSGPTAGGRP